MLILLNRKYISNFITFILLLYINTIFPVNSATLKWQGNLPNLPAPHGNMVQHGVAGAYSGVLKKANEAGDLSEVIIVAGGANFSKQPLLDAIKADMVVEKIYHQAIYLLSKSPEKSYQWLQAQINLPLGAAYGKSFNTSKGIMLFGGEVKQPDGSVAKTKDIGLLSFKKGLLNYEKIGEMPFSFAKGAGSYFDGKIYLIGGIQDDKASNNVYSYDVKTSTWQIETPYPGKARVEPVATIHNDAKTKTTQLFVFSGFTPAADKNINLDDGLSLNISAKTSTWQTIPSIPILQSKQQSLSGAASIKINTQQTLFLGGFNKKTWDDWLTLYHRIKGTDAEKAAKIQYFSQLPQNFNWNREGFLFDSSTQTWSNLGETPFLPNCGAAIQQWQNNIVLINGEIMPGVRTATVKMAHITLESTINK
jgi:cyclically-permuted mutarotase family protein